MEAGDVGQRRPGPFTAPGPARVAGSSRLRVLGRIAGILVDLEAAICRELGADQIPPKTGSYVTTR